MADKRESTSKKGLDSEALAEAKRILSSLLHGLKSRVYLFGSRANGKAWPSSDIDIAILPMEPLPRGLLSQIREELEESNIPFHVDLIDLSQADIAFRKRVEEEGILLWKD